ncbi:MAG TPA: hypothetical protein VI956_11125 [Nitrospirota bacterium]|nr:hypothetical protein [Nitrospirota bacterium]
MSEVAAKLIGLVFILVVFLPLGYIYYFLIWQLPKKFGFFRRWSIVFGYIFIFFIDTYLLSEGFIGLLIFFLVPLLIQLGGAYYFRAELKEDLQKICWKLKNE